MACIRFTNVLAKLFKLKIIIKLLGSINSSSALADGLMKVISKVVEVVVMLQFRVPMFVGMAD